jgi:flagellin-like protein
MSIRRAVAPLIATIILVAITVIGGISVFVFIDGFYDNSPNIEAAGRSVIQDAVAYLEDSSSEEGSEEAGVIDSEENDEGNNDVEGEDGENGNSGNNGNGNNGNGGNNNGNGGSQCVIVGSQCGENSNQH